MTRFPKKGLPQTVTYWGDPTPDGFGGFTYDAPITIEGRWEDRAELFVNEQGEEQQSSAVVYLAADVVLGGWLALGDYTDSAYDSPASVVEARKILGRQKIPNLKATAFLRKAWL